MTIVSAPPAAAIAHGNTARRVPGSAVRGAPTSVRVLVPNGTAACDTGPLNGRRAFVLATRLCGLMAEPK